MTPRWSSARSGPPGPRRRLSGRRVRRELSAFDDALTLEAPRLVAMFGMFNLLAAGEPVVAPETRWPRRHAGAGCPDRPLLARPLTGHRARLTWAGLTWARLTWAGLVLAVAAVLAAGAVLSASVRPAARACSTAAAAAGYVMVRAPGCAAYATGR